MSVALLLDKIDTEALVQSWVAAAARDDEIDRRDRFRLPFFNAATLDQGGHKKGVMCRNISKAGIGIIEYGAPPQRRSATLAVSLHNKIVHLGIDFKWRHEIGDGWWTSGGKLNSASLSRASLIVLQLSSMLERRIHRRHTFCHPFTTYPTLDVHKECVGVENIPPEEESSAFSMDISRGGMRLLCLSKIAPSRKTIYLRKPDTATTLQGRIVSHKNLENGYSVMGVKFPTT